LCVYTHAQRVKMCRHNTDNINIGTLVQDM